MIAGAVFLLFVGVLLSGFFSGSETGFYRASRVRIVIAGLDGDRLSRYLLKMVNNPSWFVATTLIGNNVANYIVSLAIVLGAKAIVTGDNGATELMAPLLMSPFLFVYGELLPKNIYYQAPNRLLRLGAPVFLFFSVIFSPVALCLWGLARILEIVVGSSPEKVRLALAKKEVQQVILEGMEAGILHPSQRLLGQNFFLQAAKPVSELCTPLAKANSLPKHVGRAEALRQTVRKKTPDLPIYEDSKSNLIGYVRAVELWVDSDAIDEPLPIKPLFRVQGTELYGETLMQMQSRRETMALVVDSDDCPLGLVTIDQLTDPLLAGPLGSLKR